LARTAVSCRSSANLPRSAQCVEEASAGLGALKGVLYRTSGVGSRVVGCLSSRLPASQTAVPRSLPPGLRALSGKVWTEDSRRLFHGVLPRIRILQAVPISLVEVCRAAMYPRWDDARMLAFD
jgi:hypothetical protein